MRSLETLKRFKPSRAQFIGGALILSSGMIAYAVVPNQFTAGTTLSATQMNDNFAHFEARIAALETDNTTLNTDNTTLKTDSIALKAKLASVSTVTENGKPTVLFRGVNVRIDNGAGSTPTANGTGNLIVGYNEASSSGVSRCTVGNSVAGSVVSDANCTNAGGTLATTFKTGSHYIIAGAGHNYSSWGGVVFGFQNTSNLGYANVTGGINNVSSGSASNVNGGAGNTANYQYATVGGGYLNNALGDASSVSGGADNISSGSFASVSGGGFNQATGMRASVTGGASNVANAVNASVSGGSMNIASGENASVSGGSSNNAGGVAGSVSGGQTNTTSNNYASVSGGFQNTASGDLASVTGGQFNVASGTRSHVSGGGNGTVGGGNVAGTNYSSVLGGVSQSTSAASQTLPALP